MQSICIAPSTIKVSLGAFQRQKARAGTSRRQEKLPLTVRNLGQDPAHKRNHPAERWLRKGGEEEGDKTERIKTEREKK